MFLSYYNNHSNPTTFYPPVDICYGNRTLDDPTSSPYFKKAIKVYTTFNVYILNGYLFLDGTGLTSWVETEYNTNKYTHTDVFTNYSWYHDSNNPGVKSIQPTDSILIDQYYGPHIYLKMVSQKRQHTKLSKTIIIITHITMAVLLIGIIINTE